uniref:Urea-proton symporter DUR3 n=1 Tax=Branchiostoma floridae TaxID=7739 RepID=C3XXN5_BRAFL|eukprot:XP_002611485.1 hypothetical protein BRAFLDRAFT_63880 [Branchiostoma floridae]
MAVKCLLGVLLLICLSAEVLGACNQTTGRNGTAGGGTGDFRPLVLLSEAVLMTLGFGLFAGYQSPVRSEGARGVLCVRPPDQRAGDRDVAAGRHSLDHGPRQRAQYGDSRDLSGDCYRPGMLLLGGIASITALVNGLSTETAAICLAIVIARGCCRWKVLASITALINGLSTETAAICLTIVIGSYTLIGGLGATFYVSYFNTALIFAVLIAILAKNRIIQCGFSFLGDQVSMIVGNLVSILSGGAICAVVSIVQSYGKTEDELMREWDKTRSVDNPLKPWGPTYQSAYKMTSANKLNDRPSFEEIRRFCRRPRMTALIAGIGLSLVLVIIWPAGMLGVYLVGEDTTQNPLGSADAVFDLLTCSSGPAGNRDQSYLTFFSTGGLMFGVINIIGNFGAVFCDQAYWQSTIAARPLQGVWGFISGGLAWFAIPFSMATTVGLAFVALSTRSGKELLSAEDVDKGLVASVVVNQLMGHTGQAILLLMLLMAVMSTGSAEVIAVTSIIVYDIYKDYISPFRRDLEEDDCVLCGRKRENPVSEDEKCFCHPISSCTKCHEENHARAQPTGFYQYTCPTHAAYRNYLDMLLGKKNIYIVVVTVATVPLVLLADAAGLNLGWLYLFMGVLIGAAVIPIGMALFWARTTAAGMISGATVGCVLALICWLGTAASFPGGLGGGNFIKNSGDQVSMIVGNLVSILSGGAICAVVSIVQSYDKTEDELMREWDKTRSVDNPLKPWGPTYQSAYKMTSANKLNDRPSFEEIRRFCRRPRMTALIAGIGLSLVLVIIWPAGMLGVGVMNGSEFQHWVNVSQTWAFLAAAFVIIVPLVQEVVSIYKNYQVNKEHGKGDQEVYQNGTATTGLPPDATVTRL